MTDLEMFDGKLEMIHPALLFKREFEFTAKLAAGKTIEDAAEIAKKICERFKDVQNLRIKIDLTDADFISQTSLPVKKN